jgi:transferase CAF17, mitochondrial
VTITDLTATTHVRVLLGPHAAAAAHKAWGDTALSLATDPRVASLGTRAILPAESTAPVAWAMAPPAAYETLRLLHGVAEGPDLVERLPSECNVDLLHGINFAKGCYLGQELTARTQFKGVVRKRLLPFFIGAAGDTMEREEQGGGARHVASLRDLLPPGDASALLAKPLRVGLSSDGDGGSAAVAKGAEVVDVDTGKALGTVVASAWPRANVGLALLRLEGVMAGGPLRLVATRKEQEKEQEKEKEGSGSVQGQAQAQAPLTVFTPLWWPALDLATGKVPSA